MDGTLTIEDAERLRLHPLHGFQHQRSAEKRADAALCRLRQGLSRLSAIQPAAPGTAQRGAPLRSVGHALRSLPRRRPAVFLRLFQRARTRRSSRRRPPRSAISPPSCCSTPGPEGARHRLAAGAAWRSTSPRTAASDVTGVTLSTEQLSVAERRAAAAGLADRVRFELMRLPRGRPGASTASSRSACSSMSASTTTTPSSARSRAAGRRRRRAAARDRPHGRAGRDQPVDCANTSSRAATRRRCRRSCRRSSAPACGHRHRDPAPALCRDAARTGARASSPTASASRALYDERFCRMWEFYLAGSEIAFRYEGHDDLPDPARQARRRRAADARLHGRLGAPSSPASAERAGVADRAGQGADRGRPPSRCRTSREECRARRPAGHGNSAGGDWIPSSAEEA